MSAPATTTSERDASRRIRQQLRAIEATCRDLREQLAAAARDPLPVLSVEDVIEAVREAVQRIDTTNSAVALARARQAFGEVTTATAAAGMETCPRCGVTAPVNQPCPSGCGSDGGER